MAELICFVPLQRNIHWDVFADNFVSPNASLFSLQIATCFVNISALNTV